MSRKRGFIYSYLLLAIEMVTSFFFTPFLVRSLGQSEYGLYSLIVSITAYLLLLDLGVGNAIVRYMSRYRVHNDLNMQQKFLGLTTLFYTFIGIFTIIIGIFIQNNISVVFKYGLTPNEIIKVQTMFSITMVNAAITMGISSFDKVILAFEHFAFSRILAMSKLVIRVALSIIILDLGGDAVDIIRINLAMTIVFGAISVLYVIFRLKIVPVFKGFEMGFIKEIIGYSSFIFIQMVATQINAMVDKVLLGIMASSGIIGIYAIGAQISQYFQSIAGCINGVLMPSVVRLVETNATSKQLLDEMVKIGRFKLSYLGLIWGVFLIYGQLFVSLWVGIKNEKAYYVALIIILPMVFSQIQSIGTNILWAKNKHRIQAYLQIAVSIINIGLTVVLIRWNPLIGASLGTCIALFIGDTVVMNLVFKKYIGISIREYYIRLFNGIGLSLVITIICGYVIKSIFSEGWIGFLIGCLCICVIYFLAMVLIGFNRNEKNVIKKYLTNAISK